MIAEKSELARHMGRALVVHLISSSRASAVASRATSTTIMNFIANCSFLLIIDAVADRSWWIFGLRKTGVRSPYRRASRVPSKDKPLV